LFLSRTRRASTLRKKKKKKKRGKKHVQQSHAYSRKRDFHERDRVARSDVRSVLNEKVAALQFSESFN